MSTSCSRSFVSQWSRLGRDDNAGVGERAATRSKKQSRSSDVRSCRGVWKDRDGSVNGSLGSGAGKGFVRSEMAGTFGVGSTGVISGARCVLGGCGSASKADFLTAELVAANGDLAMAQAGLRVGCASLRAGGSATTVEYGGLSCTLVFVLAMTGTAGLFDGAAAEVVAVAAAAAAGWAGLGAGAGGVPVG
jgi:hypothetical protein